MILPATYNLYPIIIGTTYDPEAMIISVDNQIKNLTGCTATLVIHIDNTVIATLTSGAGLVIDHVNGMIAPYITSAITASYAEGEYNYYLNITEADATTVYRYVEGNVEVRV